MRQRLDMPKLIVLILAIPLLAVSIFFRVWHLGNIPGINADEALCGIYSLNILSGHNQRWLTPNGNVYSPLFFIPCVVLHAVLPPSFLIMRGVAVFSGLLLLLVNYWLCRRVFGWGTAVASTVSLAVLPENIAQSRFGWEPSQSVLVDALVVYCSLLVAKDEARSAKWAAWGVVALAAAFLTHPTNVFTSPLLLFAIVWRWRNRLAWMYPARPFTVWKVAFYAALPVAVYALAGVASRKLTSVGTMPADAAQVPLPVAYANLFSGVTVLRYIPGSLLPANTPPFVLTLWTVIPCAVFAGVLLFAVWFLACRRTAAIQDRILFAGWAASAALFLAVAGPAGFSEGNERYALCLIVPGVLAVCRSILAATASRRILGYVAAAGGALVCGALLAGFYVNYFQFFENTGGNAHLTFRTAEIEPKRAAWDLIRSQATGPDPFVVTASEFWTFAPLQYLAETDHRAVVMLGHQFNPAMVSDAALRAKLTRAFQSGRVWSVEFHDSEYRLDTLAFLNSHGIRYSLQQIPDYSGRPVVDVIH